jgi:hypothetical protein
MLIDRRISANIAKIKAFIAQDQVLRRYAHHFLYDKRYTDADCIQFVVMGINPGEPKGEPNIRNELPLEETSEYDFMKDGVETPSAARWKNNCSFICQTLDVALTEALLWSSYNLSELNTRYKKARENYLKFAVPLNQELIHVHNPRAVVVVGISRTWVEEIASLYGLSPAGEVHYSQKRTRKDRVVAPYKDVNGRPWLFLKHWSNRPTNSEKEIMRAYVTRCV